MDVSSRGPFSRFQKTESNPAVKAQIQQPPPTTVFHGTAANYVDSFRQSKPRIRLQHHTRACFCTSESFDEAARFAIRHTPACDLSATGVVLEFDCSAAPKGSWARVKDTATMWEEKEVAFYRTERLRLVAVWHLRRGGWERVPEPISSFNPNQQSTLSCHL